MYVFSMVLGFFLVLMLDVVFFQSVKFAKLGRTFPFAGTGQVEAGRSTTTCLISLRLSHLLLPEHPSSIGTFLSNFFSFLTV